MVEVIVEELDRLGRNADGIKKELEWFKDHGICVRILEIPTTLIEVSEQNKWVIELINNILIEVYASMAQAELEKRAKRQAEGVEAAMKKGVKFGRPSIKIDNEKFTEVVSAWRAGKITAVEAQRELGVKPNTFYRRVREYEKGGET
jgi:DNA invertase Pin-like site-specific DNA recombinase